MPHTSIVGYLIELQRRACRPPHTVIDDQDEVGDLAGSRDIDLANTSQLLVGDVEVLQEDHDGASRDFRLKRVL